jgi:hypothetical protein
MRLDNLAILHLDDTANLLFGAALMLSRGSRVAIKRSAK